MHSLTVFVPEYVNLDTIDKCFRDKLVLFEHVDSATFDATAQQSLLKRFMFLEKDHFLVYPDKGEPFKCHYQSRSVIMNYVHSGYNQRNFDFTFKEVNGLRMNEQKPIHYFVCSKGSDSLGLTNATEDNTIVEYFDSEEDEDLAKFAEIVKTKPNCNQKHFIVYRGDDYCAVETDNVQNIYVFSSILRYQVLPKLVAGTETIDTLIDGDRNLENKLAKPDRQPGFKLRDSSGEIIPDGINFALQILRDREEDENDEDEDEIEGLSKEELFYCNKDWVGVNSYMDDGKDYFLCAQESNYVSFECETIDDIVYLKHDGGYFYFDIDNKFSGIFIGKAVPTKEQRVQIHYDNNGDICLTAWGGRVYVACGWFETAYNVVRLDDTEKQLCWGSPMKLRLVRL